MERGNQITERILKMNDFLSQIQCEELDFIDDSDLEYLEENSRFIEENKIFFDDRDFGEDIPF